MLGSEVDATTGGQGRGEGGSKATETRDGEIEPFVSTQFRQFRSSPATHAPQKLQRDSRHGRRIVHQNTQKGLRAVLAPKIPKSMRLPCMYRECVCIRVHSHTRCRE
eukprot:108311-Pleurochrysis_carterae.AAC.1